MLIDDNPDCLILCMGTKISLRLFLPEKEQQDRDRDGEREREREREKEKERKTLFKMQKEKLDEKDK